MFGYEKTDYPGQVSFTTDGNKTFHAERFATQSISTGSSISIGLNELFERSAQSFDLLHLLQVFRYSELTSGRNLYVRYATRWPHFRKD